MSAIIINDPVYGFTSIPRGLLGEIIRQPEFQRLDHIRQLGTSSFVYPSAKHSRKQHSIGAFHLMQDALLSLSQKGEFIFDSEQEAVEAAILLHDVGHGPFSHVLENVLTQGVSHEEISLMVMERLNQRLNGEISLAIKIFKDEYPKHFFHELLSSQLDMDRMDYVNRDSFYCGVQEGSIGAARIIKMLNVKNDHLVVEHKGLFTVENYLMARRLMYWQVYLHKTVVAAEEVLRSTLRRAKELAASGESLFCTPALHFYLYNNVNRELFHRSDDALEYFLQLTDADILCSLNVWQYHSDRILSTLSKNFVTRRLFKVEVLSGDTTDIEIAQHIARLRRETADTMNISEDEATYFVLSKRVSKDMYSATSEGIDILQTDGTVKEMSTLSNIVRGDTPQEYKDKSIFVFRQRFENE